MPKLAILAKPNAKKSMILRKITAPLEDGRRVTDTLTIEVALAAPPLDGRANDELVLTLAKALGLKKKDVVLLSGETGRNKLVELSGIDEEQLRARIDAALGRSTT